MRNRGNVNKTSRDVPDLRFLFYFYMSLTNFEHHYVYFLSSVIKVITSVVKIMVQVTQIISD